MSIKAETFLKKVNRKDELAGRLTAVQGKTRKRCMTVIRTTGLLMLGLFCSALVSSPAFAQSKEAQWKEFKKEIKQACGEYWNAHKGELEYDSRNHFVEQCWIKAKEASLWTNIGGQPYLTQEIFCPKYQTKIKLNYRIPHSKQAETCVTFR
jgi:hypothetical protein